tara:strand:- start:6847 stop:7041 length:195 start_codon:yes stop_codon:yes gene_type:complete
MKVGDLVTAHGSAYYNRAGVVVRLPFVGDKGQSQQVPRAGVLWADRDRIDWMPVCWLEVISESR